MRIWMRTRRRVSLTNKEELLPQKRKPDGEVEMDEFETGAPSGMDEVARSEMDEVAPSETVTSMAPEVSSSVEDSASSVVMPSENVPSEATPIA
jgi:hypothetical protein